MSFEAWPPSAVADPPNGVVSEVPAPSASPSPEARAGAGATSGPRLPRREGWIDLPEEYSGFRFRAWINAPQRVRNELRSGDEARMMAAMGKIVLEHNGWCDQETGEPLPPASDPQAFWSSIDNELASVIITLIDVEAGKLAASVKMRSGR